MKAQDLRIGNLIHDKLHRNVIVSEIRQEYLVFYLSNGNKIKHNIKTFTPIQLTDKWLLKFSFKFWGGIYCDRNDFFALTKKNKGYSIEELDIEINHVNELQNLYYSLTGKELNG